MTTLYHGNGHSIDDIHLAGSMLTPLLGNAASIIFALALLLAGISSSITAGMAGGTIFLEFMIILMIFIIKIRN